MLLSGNYATKKCLLYKRGKLWYYIVKEQIKRLDLPKNKNFFRRN